MNNQCINFRQRTKTTNKKRKVYFYCAKQRKEITFDGCRGCIYKEYKTQQYNINKNKTQSKNKISLKQKSNKLAKLERNRFSIITNNMEVCILCGRKKDHIHEIFFGRNRINSMKYGLCIPLCNECHTRMHKDTKLQGSYHKIGQNRFNRHYSNLDFMEIFKINYL